MSRARHYDWRAASWTALGTVAGVVLFVMVVRHGLGWDVEAASRSPLATRERGGPGYAGWLGSFGVLGWTLSAAITALGATVMRRRHRPLEARFLAASTVLSAGLSLDDLFMVHSTLAPQYLGIPKPAVLLGIVAVVALWALVFRVRLLDDPDLPILVWAIGFAALALWIDGYGPPFGWGGVREEAAKLIGVATWLIFFWRTTLRSIDGRERG